MPSLNNKRGLSRTTIVILIGILSLGLWTTMTRYESIFSFSRPGGGWEGGFASSASNRKAEALRQRAEWEALDLEDSQLIANGTLYFLDARLTMTYDDDSEGFFHISFLSKHVFKRRMQESNFSHNWNLTYYTTLLNLTHMERLKLRCQVDDDGDDQSFDMRYLPEEHWDSNVPDNIHTYEADLSSKLSKRELLRRWEGGERFVRIRLWIVRWEEGLAAARPLARVRIPLDSLTIGRMGVQHPSYWMKRLGGQEVSLFESAAAATTAAMTKTESYLHDASSDPHAITLCVRLTESGRPYLHEWLHHHFEMGAKHVIIGYHPWKRGDNMTRVEEDMMDFARFLQPFLERGLVSIATITLRPTIVKWNYNLLNVFFDNVGCLYTAKGLTKYVGIWDLDEYWLPKRGDVKGALPRTLREMEEEDERIRTNATTISSSRTPAASCPKEEMCYYMFPSHNAGIHPHYKAMKWNKTSVIGLDYALSNAMPSRGWEKSISYTKRAYLTGSHYPSCRRPRRGYGMKSEMDYYTPHPRYAKHDPCFRLAEQSGYVLHYLAMFRFNTYYVFNLSLTVDSPYMIEFKRKMREEDGELRFREEGGEVFLRVPIRGA